VRLATERSAPVPGALPGLRRGRESRGRRLQVVVLAKQLGFSLAEIRVILSGISAKSPPPQLWRELAARKLPEVEGTLNQAKAMKRILETGMRCKCLTLEDCLAAIAP